MGADTYKDTGIKIYPHFSVENAEEMVESGVIQIGSHTFDMHQSEELERNSGILKPNMLRPAGMPEEDYIRMVKDDLDKFGELYKNIENRQVTLLAYPYGLYDQELTALLHESGIRGTFTTEPGISTIIKGLPQTLMNLKRISINEDTDIEAVLGSLP